MSFLRRRAWITLLALVVLLAPLTALAQDAAVRIDGSRIVADLVAPLSDAYAEEAGVDISLEISGTNSGLARLCNGEIDIANAARPITSDEAALCADNDVEWVEVLMGYDALAVIANPTFARTECLPFSDLSALMGPSATETIINLQSISPIYDNIDFVLYAPASDTTTYNLLDELLPGDGLRSDLNTQESVDDLITLVADDVAGLGVAPLSAVLASDAAVNTIALDDLSGAGCIPASEETLTDGTYPGARGLFLYVNAASLENEAVTGLMDALLNADAQATVAEMGFSPLGDDVLSAMQTNVADSVTGRTVSEGEPLYSIPLDVEGTVLVDTAATAFGAAESVTNQFSGAYSTAAVNLTGFGNSATYRKLCAGESDLGFVTRAATGDELAACEDNGVALWEARWAIRPW
jgi:phosphate transport system substrate-binding protein